ncbi:hypothetical protein FH972_026193 [Carpinus fangiana]|uniref:MPN domain-containing protein n=1 Tax=Carpinus fangiana TaxID=176857 RepID=A0A5N6L387_9ROSI|nr:hypothetical protein FH972_026193 [Carpinus fangiana]
MAQIKKEDDAHPWRKDPHHFQEVCISAIALLKMTMHARSGGELEIMGLMQGYVSGNKLIVTDALRLPVEGTETRVNAQDEANEYMVKFLEKARESGQLENAIGWYHSHPGYGCWLSGIDVQTEITMQMQGPWCAIVIDPDRTISAGKVEIGAFRTFPEDYKPGNQEGGTDGDGFQTVPLSKMEDFGAHSERYYALEVSHFKSSLDSKLLEALWNKYWVGTLSSSPLFTNRDFATKQMAELARKIQGAEKQQKSKGGAQNPAFTAKKNKLHDEQLRKIIQASNKIVAEEEAGLLATDIKKRLFQDISALPSEDTHVT